MVRKLILALAIVAVTVVPLPIPAAGGGHGGGHGSHGHHRDHRHHFLGGGFYAYAPFPYGYPCWWEEGRWINQLYMDRSGGYSYVPQWVPGQWMCWY